MVALNGTPMNGFTIDSSTAGHVGMGFPATRVGAMDEQQHDGPQDADHDSLPALDPWPVLVSDDLEGERVRLAAEIADAKARTAAAMHRAAVRDAEVRAALRAELVASKEALSEMERQHDVAIAMVRAAAQTEVDRILADARQLVADLSRRALGSGGEAVNNAE